jgi:hypothetical protein
MKTKSAIMSGFLVVALLGSAAAQLTWTHLAPGGTPPPPRARASVVFVEAAKAPGMATGTMYLFGGLNSSGQYFNDMYKLTLQPGQEQWTRIPEQGPWPSLRDRMVLAYDRAGHRILGFGGATGNYVVLGDNWAFDLGTERWSRIDSTPWFLSPSPRVGPDYAFDEAHHRVYLFGGTTFQVIRGYQAGWWLYDTWSLDCSTAVWQQLSPYGSLPSPRQGGIGILDRRNDRFVFFCGQASNNIFVNETWTIGPLAGVHISFNQLNPAGTPPPPMRHPVAVYDSNGQRMIVFSGQDDNGQLNNTVWELGLTPGSEQWRTLSPGGTPPPPLYLAAAVFDEPTGRMVVFGGDAASGSTNDVYTLEGLFSGTEAAGPMTLPSEDRLLSVRPNPTGGQVRFDYSLGKPASVDLKLYDVTGRLLRSLSEAAATPGAHSLVWDGNSGDGRPCPSGVYLYSWRAGGKEAKGKIVKTR